MAKTEDTLQLERSIWLATRKQGVFGCFEVTIGWFGSERVDYMTYDTNHIFRCYEIKVSKSDFHSKAHNTFCGHYNYYVMPKELYAEVKAEISDHIGVYCDGWCVKRAKKRDCVDENTLKDSLLRSLYRESEKIIKSDNPTIVERLQLKQVEREKERYRKEYWELMRIGQEKYGARWYGEGD